ncbi:hypothetical protein ACS127_12945 [Amphibacillus sp. Q70]|uniref:hypothetical protein n=1 Tax=Amphibacillus sp. Q70 TaxID=3453416 RepID=UPI003F83BAC1
MNKNYLKSLDRIANQLELSFDKQTAIIFGVFNGYMVCLIPFNETYTFTLKLSISRKNEMPDSELVKQVVSESKIIANCKVQGYQVTYTLKAGNMFGKKSGVKLQEGLEKITNFLKTEDFQNCCQDCGTEEALDIYNVSGIPLICCESCFKDHCDKLSASEYAQKQKQENLIGGLVGALLGSLIGVIAIVIFGQLGYVSAVSGIIMGVCSLKGYELLGGKLSNKGIIGSGIVMIIMVYFGTRLDWSISVANYFIDIDILTAFRVLPTLMTEGYIEARDYYVDLALVYLFTALGAIPTVISLLRNRKVKNASYKMSEAS